MKVTPELIRAITVHPQHSVRDAMKAISTGTIGIVLVADEADGRFLGVLTDGDIRRGLLAGLGLEAPVERVEHPPSKAAPVGTSREEIRQMIGGRVAKVVPLLDGKGRVADLAFFPSVGRLSVAEPDLTELELEYVSECVLTGWVSSAGRFVTDFEKLVAEQAGVAFAVATSSGTTALHLALAGLDIGPGDEVIVPTLSFVASANAVVYTGARPVFVDVDPDNWTLSLEGLKKALTPRTKAIMPVHLYGHPADMDGIKEIAGEAFVIEDAAEAQGSFYKGKPAGSLGTCGIFSFFGNKVVTTGEGGMVLTDDAKLAERVRILRDHGMTPGRRYWHDVLGYNYRMTNLQAALGVAQMERFATIAAAKKRNAESYLARLGGVPGLKVQATESWADSIYWLLSVAIEEKTFGKSRDEVIDALQAAGIESRPLFPCLHRQPIYDTGQSLPVAEHLSANGLSLPSSTRLQASDIQRICDFLEGVD